MTAVGFVIAGLVCIAVLSGALVIAMLLAAGGGL